MHRYFYSLFIVAILPCIGVHARPFWQPKSIGASVDVSKLLYYSNLRNVINKNLSYNYSVADKRLGSLKPLCPKYEGNQYEFSIDLQFQNWILDFDFGWGNLLWKNSLRKMLGIPEDQNIESKYKNSGNYIKFGFDYNFLSDTPENNAAFLGLRCGLAFFKDELNSSVIFSSKRIKYVDSNQYTSVSSKLTKVYPISSTQENLFARWFETVAGVKIRVFGPVFVGANVSYKFWLDIYGAHKHKPYEIIGWGMTTDPVDKTAFGLNFYLSISIPLSSEDGYDRRANLQNPVNTNVLAVN